MKVIYVILFGMVMFNAVLIATNEIGIFQYVYEPRTDEGSIIGYGNYAASTMTLTGLFTIGGLLFGGLGAWVSKSYVPIGAGAFLGFCTGMWSNTYMTLQMFTLPLAFLGIGTIAMGILMVYATIDIMTAQGE